MKILLATRNQNKVDEIKLVMKEFSVEIETLDNFPEVGEIEETGNTLTENALLKARTVNQRTGRPSMGDDTGLEVDALNGAPGVYSARYAGENVTYADNVNKLLQEMSQIKEKNRTARFRTIAAFSDGKTELISQGIIKGTIIFEPSGSSGFGYDPVFYVPEMKCTFAELSTEEKNRISHRGQAFNSLYKKLAAYWGVATTQGE